jgi:hypothetical protein
MAAFKWAEAPTRTHLALNNSSFLSERARAGNDRQRRPGLLVRGVGGWYDSLHGGVVDDRRCGNDDPDGSLLQEYVGAAIGKFGGC